MKHVSIEAYANYLVQLAKVDLRAMSPERRSTIRSWSDLHGVVDANEYLLDADAFWKVNTLGNVTFTNAAIDIAEKALFPKEEN